MTVHYARRTPRLEPETACSGLECAAVSVVDSLLVFVWFGAFLLVIGALLIPRARSICEEECSRTREEARAFERFATRVSELDPAQPGGSTGRTAAGPTAVSVTSSPNDRGLSKIREAYRGTVMSVPHYEEEYDESLQKNVSEEFEPEVATVLTEGSRLTPRVKRALVERAFESRNRREQFLEVLFEETDSLEHVQERLTAVESTLRRMDEQPLPGRSYGELEDVWNRLNELEQRVESVLRNRQETMRTIGGGSHRFADPWTMYAYLYRPLASDHPALADGTRVLESVRTAKRRVALSLTARV
ncbi:DUF7260 family protein [Natrialbaceae archaeon A-gly3]